MGGIFGMMGGMMRASDERIKENVHRVGTVFAADPHGERQGIADLRLQL